MIVQLRSLFTSLDKDGGYDAYISYDDGLHHVESYALIFSVVHCDCGSRNYQDCFA